MVRSFWKKYGRTGALADDLHPAMSRLPGSSAEFPCRRLSMLPDNHTFDAARQGYVNLLLAHRSIPKEPGDSADMIKSRRRFLDRGHYDRVSDGINEAVAGNRSIRSGKESVYSILDAGCGEGFYLKRLKESLAGWPGVRFPLIITESIFRSLLFAMLPSAIRQ